MSTNVGSIHYDVSLDTSKFDSASNKINGNLAGMSDAFGQVAGALGTVLKTIAVGAIGSSIGVGAMAKAAFDQVGAVEQASLALKAYETNGAAVNAVLKDLVSYARSDMGVLFQRQDLFAAAQSLKIMGDNTGSLVDHVKILSRSVGLGLSNWTDLNMIVGRVGSTGRLTGDDFDNLTKAGYRLSPSLRNTNINFEQLFQALDKGIPASALAGQANTIQGRMIRLQSAFRDLGLSLLGVDKDTSQFIKGGLGDRLINLLEQLRVKLSSKEFKEAFTKLGKDVAAFAEKALPVLLKGFEWLITHFDTVIAGIGALTAAWLAASVAAIILSAAAAPGGLVMLAIAAAVTALVGALVFAELKWHIFSNALGALGTVWGILQPILGAIVNWFVQVGIGAANAVMATINWFAGLPTMIGNAITATINWLAKLPENIAFALGWLVGRFILFVTSDMPNFINGIQTWFEQLPGRVMNAMISLYNTINSWFNNAKNAAGNAASGLVNWVANVLYGLPGVAGNVVSQIVGFFAGLPGRALSALGNFAGQIMDRLRNIAASAWEGFKKGLGIHSPSYIEKAFMAISDQAATTVDDMKDTMGSLASMASTNLRNNIGVNYSASLNGLPPGGTSNAVTTNITGPINIGSEVDADSFLARLTRNQETALRGAALPVGGRG